MNRHFCTLTLSLLILSFAPSRLCAGPRDDALEAAEAAVRAAAPRAQADPTRPIFHVTSPAQWMNDPNGPIYYKGWYHMFYQLHPFGDGGGPKYWGHVRSRDLAKWEPLPIALRPSTESGEAEVWSGCCTINGRGEPMIFYTSIAPGKSALTNAEQWAAIGDDDLLTWRKSPANPVLSESLHGATKIYDWRDPFVFQCRHRTFLVTGGNLNEAKGGEAVVNIYEAQNPELTQWKYRGVLFKLPDPRARTAECPNFFQLGDRWVLFVSPYGKVHYYVGDFDPDTCRFTAQTHGIVDCGPNFYAPNTMLVPDGRRITWGWVIGFPGGHGWNGCLTVPRQLSVSRDGQLQQEPAPQLAKLRGKAVQWRNLKLEGEAKSFDLPGTNTLEIALDLDLQKAESITLGFKSGTNDTSPLLMNFNDAKFQMPRAEAPLALSGKDRKLNLRIFVDRSVLEVFANETVCATKIISPLSANATLEIRALGGAAKLKSLQAWPMKTIW
jgi:beta-fructofuranosidase